MISLNNRTALITGGSKGIGRECVRLLAKAGADVAFTFNQGKNESDRLIHELKNENMIKSYKVSLEQPEEIEAAVKLIIKEFGNIDILINNAGIWKKAPIDNMKLEDWNETMQINLTSTFLFSKHVIPHMKQNNFGRIINISSTAGQRGEAFHSHYAASKGGMIAFTKSLASELGKFNITVNCVAPGWVITGMTKESLADERKFHNILEDIPLKKIANPEEIAGPVLFLASGLASHITGEILNVNGGSVLCG